HLLCLLNLLWSYLSHAFLGRIWDENVGFLLLKKKGLQPQRNNSLSLYANQSTGLLQNTG
ncbi:MULTISPECIES: hypothetical protein, partial [unclassified Providencia]|uniref:hypothetical protein n=1 Tax=unclassified Providencia TaxID=2633465 RepID=UPI002349923D